MKVNTTNIEGATFKRFRYWSDWIDISIFTYAGNAYLIQMSVSRSNKKRFRSVSVTGRFTHIIVNHQGVGDLTSMSAAGESGEEL